MSSRKAMVFWGCVLMSLLIVPMAQAQRISIPPGAFRSFSDAQYDLTIEGWGTSVVKNTIISSLIAPVFLPDGAIIKNIRVMYLDNTVTFMQVWLCRVNMFTELKEDIFDVTSSGQSASIRSMVDSSCPIPAWRLVNNGACQYFVRVHFDSCDTSVLKLYGISIEYQ